MLATLAAKGKNVMSHTDSNNLLTSTQLTTYGTEDSDVFNAAPGWLLEAAEKTDVAPNFHHFSLLRSTYDNNADIQEIFHVVSESYDRNNLKFVDIMESKKLVQSKVIFEQILIIEQKSKRSICDKK